MDVDSIILSKNGITFPGYLDEALSVGLSFVRKYVILATQTDR
jgi:hypothetical protein